MSRLPWSLLDLARLLVIFVVSWVAFKFLLGLVIEKVFHKHIKIQRVGWFSLNGIVWLNKGRGHARKEGDDSSVSARPVRIQSVSLERVALVARPRGAKHQDWSIGWIGLSVSGVRVKLALEGQDGDEEDVTSTAGIGEQELDATAPEPKDIMKDKYAHHSRKAPADDSSLVHTAFKSGVSLITLLHRGRRSLRRRILQAIPLRMTRRIARFGRTLRHRVVSPLLSTFNSLARSANILSTFVAAEFTDLSVEASSVGAVFHLDVIRLGGELVRGKNSHIGVWLRLQGALFSVVPYEDDIRIAKAALSTPALDLSVPLLLEAKAHFDSAIGIAGLYHRNKTGSLEARRNILDICMSFPGAVSTGEPSIAVNLDAFILLVDRVKHVLPRPDPHLGPHLEPHIHPTERKESGSPRRGRTLPSMRNSAPAMEPIQPRQNPVATLRSVNLCLPHVRIQTCVYPSKSRSCQKKYLSHSNIRGFALRVTVGRIAAKTSRHIEFFGKNEYLKATGDVGFDSIDVNVRQVDDDFNDLSDSERVLDLSTSALHASSTWLPPKLEALLAPPIFLLHHSSDLDTPQYHARSEERRTVIENPFSQDLGRNMLVIQADLGGVHGVAGIEVVQNMLEMLPVKSDRLSDTTATVGNLSSSSPHRQNGRSSSRAPAPADEDKTLQIYDPPVLACAIEIGRVGYRVYGPSGQPHKSDFGPGEDDGDLSLGWDAHSALCVHVPGASLHLNSEYVDLSLKRTDAERRELRRQMARGRMWVPDILSSTFEPNHAQTQSGENKRAAANLNRDTRRKLFEATEDDAAESSQAAHNQSHHADHSLYSSSNASSAGLGQPFQAASGQDGLASWISPPTAPHGVAQGNRKTSVYEISQCPFFYKVNVQVICAKVEVFLMGSREGQKASTRANPTSAGPSRNEYRSRHDSQRNHAGGNSRKSKTSHQTRHDVFYIGPLEVYSAIEFAGKDVHEVGEHDDLHFSALLESQSRHGILHFQVESLGGDVSNMAVHHALHGVLCALAAGKVSRHKDRQMANPEATAASSHKPRRPIVDGLPKDMYIVLSLAHIDMHVAGPDPKFSPDVCRGLAVQVRNTTLEYYQQTVPMQNLTEPRLRAALALREDIRAHSNAHFISNNTGQRAGYFKLDLTTVTINPVKDAGHHSRILKAQTMVDAGAVEPGSGVGGDLTWELKNRDQLSERSHFTSPPPGKPYRSTRADGGRGRSPAPPTPQPRRAENRPEKETAAGMSHAFIRDYFWLPRLTLRVSLWKNANTEDQSQSTPTNRIGVALDAPTLIARVEIFQVYCFLLAISTFKSLSNAMKGEELPSPEPADENLPMKLTFRADLPEAHLYITLPHDVRLFSRVRRLSVRSTDADAIVVKLDTCVIAGLSIAAPGLWDDIIRLRGWEITLAPQGGEGNHTSRLIAIQGQGGRVRLPFKFPFSNVIDNSATFLKTVKQLIHQFVHGKYGSAVEPSAEEAKHVPEIRVALKVLVLEAQDDPFETKLNLIWRAGVEEQEERMLRDKFLNEALEKRAARRASKRTGVDSECLKKADFADQIRPGDAASSGQDCADRDQNGVPLEPEAVSIDDLHAYRTLQECNSREWIRRHRSAMATRARREEAQMRRLYGGMAVHASEPALPIQMVSTAGTAPLLRLVLEHPVIKITKPSFSTSPTGLEDFLYDVGKGQPKDTKYSLLVPFHMDWQMSEARVHVRDYPLPLLYIPPVQQHGTEAKSWHLTSDFVVAEESGGADSTRHVASMVVPRSMLGSSSVLPYVMRIPRTAMPVKTYALPTINITSTWATRFGWGNSIQPAIQDVMRVMDTLTKAPPDPSERVGFWDKIRLILHWRIAVNFLGDGPVHFILKGSRNPYNLQDTGAGFALSWLGHVRFRIGFDNPDREFLQITSDAFELGVPDLRDYIDAAATGVMREQPATDDPDDRSVPVSAYGRSEVTHFRAYRRNQAFAKVCAKFLGGVRWGMGIQLERTCRDHTCDRCSGSLFERQCRFFDFKPHYEVKTISGPDAAVGPLHDSYAEFRSDFIHFSISVVSNLEDDEASSIHLTPVGFTHFFAWWHLFDSAMSLPVRHGPLFPSTMPPSKKFGKHCATIKFRIQLAPVYIAHTYKQDSWEDWHRGQTNLLGIKGRISHFNVDIHMREQIETVRSEHLGTTRQRLHKAFSRAEVDCKDVDLRVLAARFYDYHKAEMVPEVEHMAGLEESPLDPLDLEGDYAISDEDLLWVDLDDYRDLLLYLPEYRSPHMRIIPCFKCPRTTYSRFSQPDDVTSDDSSDADSQNKERPTPVSKFGTEPTHTCLLNKAADVVEVQLEASEQRLSDLQSQYQEATRPGATSDRSKMDEISRLMGAAQKDVDRLRLYRDRKQSLRSVPDLKERAARQDALRSDPDQVGDLSLLDDLDLWINRLVMHNPNLVISPKVRDVLLRYYYSSRQKRLFDYTMTARAIKFISEMANELGSSTRESSDHAHKGHHHHSSKAPRYQRSTSGACTRIDFLEKTLNDLGTSWTLKQGEQPDSGSHDGDSSSDSAFDLDPQTEAGSGLPDSHSLRNSFIVSILRPQLLMDAETGSTLVLTSAAVQLRVFEVIDDEHANDPINAQVMHRSFGAVNKLQAFYPQYSGWRSGRHHELVHGARNFVPLEMLADATQETEALARVVQETSARIRYDKYNRLRLLTDNKKSGSGRKESSARNTVDRLAIDCPKFIVEATPKHYGAIYDVVTNLVLYTDPDQSERSQKIEKFVLSKDFSNLASISNSVRQQQESVRETRARLNAYLSQGFGNLEEEEARSAYETAALMISGKETLTLWMGAIQAAQEMKSVSNKSKGLQLDARSNEIVWHMQQPDRTSLIAMQIRGVAFRWLSNEKGIVQNALLVSDLLAKDISPVSAFEDRAIVSKHFTQDNPDVPGQAKLFAGVLWSILPPVGGISIVDRFDVHLHPVKLQLEQRIGKEITDYIFSQRASRKQKHDEQPRRISNFENGSATSLNDDSSDTSRRGQPRISGDDRSLDSGTSLSSLQLSNPQVGFVKSSQGPRSLRPMPSRENLASVDSQELALSSDNLDAEEMRDRSRSNRTFLHIKINPTILCLSFKGEKSTSLPDLYGLVYKSPAIVHCNRIWTYLDLLEQIKKDYKSSIWSQSATLLGQILTTARKPKQAAQQKTRNITSAFRRKSGQPPQPQSIDGLTSTTSPPTKSSPLRGSVVRISSYESDDSPAEGGQRVGA